MQAVITFKWQQWAQRALHIELGLYLVWLLSFQAFILLFQVWAHLLAFADTQHFALIQACREPAILQQ